MTWGATSEDWQAWEALGLTADLLPVVADPAAKRSPLSAIREPGKVPSRFNAAGEMVGFPKWTQHRSTDRDVGRWSRDSRLGICLQSRVVKGFDIDIADPVHAAAVADILELTLGALPTRGRSNSGKRLLAFRLAVDFPKRVIKTAHGNIELLSTGQQFIICSTHPSGVRYAWAGGTPTQIPELTMAEVDCAWQALVDLFALPDGASEERRGMVPTVPRSADDMTDPTVAWLDANGWVTGYERDGKVFVRCPWEDGHSVDTGPSSTTWLPAGVGDFAQGHFKCLHASCSKRTDGDFLEEVGYTASSFDVVETLPNDKGDIEQPLPPFVRDRRGAPLATINNVVMAVQRPDVCGARIGYDRFKDALLFGAAGCDKWRQITDNDYVTLRRVLERKGFVPIGREMMRDAVIAVSIENEFDSAMQWAEGLQWDGIERVNTFFADRFGVEPGPYATAVARYTWSALAARCVDPGAKCDMVPVFVGLQAAGKTTAVEAFCPIDEAFTEVDLGKKDEDLARQMRGKLVGEIAELKGLASRDAESIKAWISRRVEEWVPKYKEHGTRFYRRLVLFGTGNKDGILDDETGERRWLPMHVGKVDVAGIEADRDQLWAEGLWLFRRHGVLWQDAFTLAPAEHSKFKVGDPWLEPIAGWLARDDMDGPRSTAYVKTIDVLLSALGFNVQRITRKEELRVGKVMRLLGWKKGNRRVDGVLAKVWERAEVCTFSEYA